jgi:aldehyde:ferredoxin oxidoreductase
MTNDGFDACGRGGMGAIMGSKNLKAIVVRGTGKVNVADENLMREAVREQVELYKKHPAFEGFRNLGTSLVTLSFYEMGHNPTFNFRQEEIRNVEAFAPENISKYIIKHYGCPNCVCHCKKLMKITKGPFAGVVWDMPEYETQWAFGNNIGNTNFESIIVFGMLCDEYGMDTISAGNVIAFAMELCELGILSKSEVGIPDLRWGNYEAALELLRKIALREGIGDVLADGVKIAAQKIGRGAEKYAMQIKGLELAAYDPRAAKAHGLSWATLSAPRHSIGWSKQEIIGLPEKVDPFSIEGKAKITKRNQDESAFCEALGFCIMVPAFNFIMDRQFAKLAYAATGIEQFKDPKYLWLVGERIINLERAFIVREGWDRKQDTMPGRIVKEPVPRKAARGQIFELEKLLDDYYEVRGWDKKTGIPTEEKLRELGLDDVAEELKKYRA